MISKYHKEEDGFTVEFIGKGVRFGISFDDGKRELGWFFIDGVQDDCGNIDPDAAKVIKDSFFGKSHDVEKFYGEEAQG